MPNPKRKPLYPIRAASKLTGLSVDTLRAWERRYKAVEPMRAGRGRKYAESDIHRLQLLRAAVEAGHAIGEIAGLADGELQEIAESSSRVPPPVAGTAVTGGERAPVDLGPIQSAVERLDTVRAEQEIHRLSVLLPPRDLIHRFTLPLMRQVGEGWCQGHLTIAQEHLVSGMLRNLLGVLARTVSTLHPSRRLLFATPAGEMHEIGTLCAAILAAAGGLGTIYLGPNLPAEEITGAARRSNSEIVVLGIVGTGGARNAVRCIHQVAEGAYPRTEIWVGGAASRALIRGIRSTPAVFIEDFDRLEQHLLRTGARW